SGRTIDPAAPSLSGKFMSFKQVAYSACHAWGRMASAGSIESKSGSLSIRRTVNVALWRAVPFAAVTPRAPAASEPPATNAAIDAWTIGCTRFLERIHPQRQRGGDEKEKRPGELGFHGKRPHRGSAKCQPRKG